MKQQRTLVLVLRENITAFTMATCIHNETVATVKESIMTLLMPFLGPESFPVTVRTDNGPAFVSPI